MTNFDFLTKEHDFDSFSSIAVAAENLLHVDVDSCVLSCRRAMESAVRWMFEIDMDLTMPDPDSLSVMLSDPDLKRIVGEKLWKRMDSIRKLGNTAAHEGGQTTEEEAVRCLEDLYDFMDFVACSYSADYTPVPFDRTLLELTPEEALSFVPGLDPKQFLLGTGVLALPPGKEPSEKIERP